MRHLQCGYRPASIAGGWEVAAWCNRGPASRLDETDREEADCDGDGTDPSCRAAA